MHVFDTLITVPYGTVHSTEIDTHIPWIYGRTYLRIDPRGLPGRHTNYIYIDLIVWLLDKIIDHIFEPKAVLHTQI